MSTPTQQQADERLIRISEVLRLVPVSRSTWYQGVKDGRYPAAVKIGPRAAAWRMSEIRSLTTNGYQAKA